MKRATARDTMDRDVRVLLTGVTGFIGTRLRTSLEAGGHEVVGVSRRPAEGDCDWSDAALGRGMEATDAVVHLAGENLFARRWSREQKARLVDSRVETTSRLAALAAQHGHRAFVSASAVGYYGPSERTGLDESSPSGDDFLADLARSW
ncbi:MAG: NAD-dependent epimerase/dehydratase family protein, partial [Thermoanaerobaculia bacterium]|nr:NAD-dependent epimerase/dehydratase family protein [Thermoanaerobaculia bacterium]